MQNVQEEDIYNEEFNRYIKLAKSLVEQLKQTADKRICMKWISKLCELRSSDPTVKKNRNSFFRYLLTIIYKCLEGPQPIHYGDPHYDDKHAESFQAGGKEYLSKWSPGKRTYVAVKPLPGRGALVYMAVAKDPTLGWEYQTH